MVKKRVYFDLNIAVNNVTVEPVPTVASEKPSAAAAKSTFTPFENAPAEVMSGFLTGWAHEVDQLDEAFKDNPKELTSAALRLNDKLLLAQQRVTKLKEAGTDTTAMESQMQVIWKRLARLVFPSVEL